MSLNYHVKVKGVYIAVRNTPHRYGNSHIGSCSVTCYPAEVAGNDIPALLALHHVSKNSCDDDRLKVKLPYDR